jgi:2-keto-4-pentenoate hydratase/2-oxohepta-3-ene-1,7-dioic acid hydratase in catechol pathway
MRHDVLAVATVIVGMTLLPGGTWAAENADRQVRRYCHFQVGPTSAYGLVEGDRVRQIKGDLFGPRTPTDTTYALSEVQLLVPTRPSKILGMAYNFTSHSEGTAARKGPELFFKAPSCLISSGAPIVIPAGATNVHPEGEMVIVIGKRAGKVPVEKAKEYVLGVTCGNDVSARDWQQGDIQWWRAKGSDTFGPCGPFVAIGVNYDDLLLRTRVNGEIRQEQRTRDLVSDVAMIVSFASRYVTLEPGDLIYAGTPGKTREIRPGDTVEVELEDVGTLRNPVQTGK